MIKNINHVSFTVHDLDRSVAFYQNVLGLKCVSLAERDEAFSSAVSGVKGAEMKIAYMEGPNCSIELIQYVKGEGTRIDSRTNNPGSTHLCFHVSDYDDWMKRMKDHGVAMRGELCVVPAGPNMGRRVCYMMDNEGNNLEFIESV